MPDERCGTCKFGRRIDLKMLECEGLPPIPVVIGARPDQLGRMQMQVENIRPRMSVTDRACSLYSFQLAQSQDLSRLAKTSEETAQ